MTLPTAIPTAADDEEFSLYWASIGYFIEDFIAISATIGGAFDGCQCFFVQRALFLLDVD
jgi:hypothetical protein